MNSKVIDFLNQRSEVAGLWYILTQKQSIKLRLYQKDKNTLNHMLTTNEAGDLVPCLVFPSQLNLFSIQI